MATKKTQIEIKRHPQYPETHSVVIVTTRRGLVYACDWAGTPETITIADALHAWQHDKYSFHPYNSSSGNYVKSGEPSK